MSQTLEQAVSTPEVQSTEPPKKRGRPCKKPAGDESVSEPLPAPVSKILIIKKPVVKSKAVTKKSKN